MCILVGGKTPFVIRPCDLPQGDVTGLGYHGGVGEVFVDGLMYYQGSVPNDIEVEEVVPAWYHLR